MLFKLARLFYRCYVTMFVMTNDQHSLSNLTDISSASRDESVTLWADNPVAKWFQAVNAYTSLCVNVEEKLILELMRVAFSLLCSPIRLLVLVNVFSPKFGYFIRSSCRCDWTSFLNIAVDFFSHFNYFVIVSMCSLCFHTWFTLCREVLVLRPTLARWMKLRGWQWKCLLASQMYIVLSFSLIHCECW